MNNKNDWFESWFDSPYYHLLYKNRNEEEAQLLINNLISYLKLNPNQSIWDLCCGKGRHSIYLNSKGFNVIGTDLSKQSIEYASQFKNDTLQFFEHDMREPFKFNHFDVVLNLFTSFGYFDNEEDDRKVFKNVHDALKNQRVFVLDFLNAEYVKQTIQADQFITIDDVQFKTSKEILNEKVIKTIKIEDGSKQFEYQEQVNLLSKSYFEKLATEVGFNILNTFGNYSLKEFNVNKSPRLLLILQKVR